VNEAVHLGTEMAGHRGHRRVSRDLGDGRRRHRPGVQRDWPLLSTVTWPKNMLLIDGGKARHVVEDGHRPIGRLRSARQRTSPTHRHSRCESHTTGDLPTFEEAGSYGVRMAPDDPDGPAWQRRLWRVVAASREWEAKGQREPEVHPSSELAGDDARWPEYPASSLVRMSLIGALDHLGLAADDVERILKQEGALRSQAPFTLTRSALLGA
jgi:hypothetical protein